MRRGVDVHTGRHRGVSPRLVVAALVWALTAAVLFAAAPAGADVFGPISLASEGLVPSVGEPQQADHVHDPSISLDGRYVAYDGSFGGVTGVWRRDLATGQVEQVAGGDAELPSISEDGRYISFTTNEGARLPAITNGRPDEHPQQEAVNVYVRDMESPVPASGHCEAPPAHCPFTVVSAPSGSEAPLTYAGTSTSTGSVAIGRSAISADGREVAFVTTAVSDLTDPQTPSEPKTPALQVAVRYLATDTTKLVSGRYEPATGQTTEAPVSGTEGTAQYGAVYPGAGIGFNPPPAYGKYGADPPPGASLSTDGSTVAWMGADVGEQAPMLPGEAREPHYTEPLWRRIEPGSETPIERVTGGSDPLSPGCLASGEAVLPQSPSPSDPCQGPFVTPEGANPSGILVGGATASFVPRLSADGYTVAFISRAPLVSLGANFGRGQLGQASDIYVANMHSNPTRPTRDQVLTPLTELAGGESAGVADTASISDFDISPGGDQVAFATRRTQFPLGSPAYVSAPAAEPGMGELFDADLRNHTLTRVTQGYEGGPSEHPHLPKPTGQDPYENEGDGALSPSFSADGNILAFSSTASNLVWGDGNTPPVEEGGALDGSDAFLVERQVFGSLPTFSSISPTPADPSLALAPSLSVTALSRPDGSVLLYVEAPGSGALRATAKSAVLLRSADRSRASRRARRSSGPRGHVRRSSRAALQRGYARATVAARTVAAATTLTQPGELATLVLRLAKPYAALASQRGGFSATASLLFVTPGKPNLRQSIAVSFLRTARASRRSSRGAHGGRRR
ncbi:MAG: hypothetical protein ACHQE6_06245 [Solirubrobacterales bacterium]